MYEDMFTMRPWVVWMLGLVADAFCSTSTISHDASEDAMSSSEIAVTLPDSVDMASTPDENGTHCRKPKANLKRSRVRFLGLEPVLGVYVGKNAPTVGIEPVTSRLLGRHHIHYATAT
ncbi:hypothetical protein DPMN_075847 [Dreissena polymorpha]|uniref:Secreted protein n=1 Tax=Dreissena polymorpha TaxID=45954 RepID=A0A9D3YIX8_DREPO|nr:hypothetical protein DPMN_075847 [Dreissena polymorpha]